MYIYTWIIWGRKKHLSKIYFLASNAFVSGVWDNIHVASKRDSE